MIFKDQSNLKFVNVIWAYCPQLNVFSLWLIKGRISQQIVIALLAIGSCISDNQLITNEFRENLSF